MTLEDLEIQLASERTARQALEQERENDREEHVEIGAGLMASQIRKAIEEGDGRFHEGSDANWILDKFAAIRLEAERELIEAGFIMMAVDRALAGQPLTEFEESFCRPREARDFRAKLEAAEAKLSQLQEAKGQIHTCKVCGAECSC